MMRRGDALTREDDEMHLAWLALRDDEKLSAQKIANRYGKTKNAVIGVLHRVNVADREAEEAQ